MRKKPWYIWLSVPALLVLSFTTAGYVSRYEKVHNIGIFNSSSFYWKARGNSFLLILVVIMLPLAFFMLIFLAAEYYAGRGSFFAILVNGIMLIFLYLSGVYATYRHVQWRERNIPHMLSPKQKTGSGN